MTERTSSDRTPSAWGEKPLRQCVYCGQQLTLEDFAGDATFCMQCHVLESKRWDDANPDKIRHG